MTNDYKIPFIKGDIRDQKTVAAAMAGWLVTLAFWSI
jgi:hypothetical protein